MYHELWRRLRVEEDVSFFFGHLVALTSHTQVLPFCAGSIFLGAEQNARQKNVVRDMSHLLVNCLHSSHRISDEHDAALAKATLSSTASFH